MAHHQAEHVCPPWLGYFLVGNPLRRLMHSPGSVLAPFVSEGMTVLEPGPGMGFFTLELARLVGSDLRLLTRNSLGVQDLAGKVDFVVAFAMVHEVPDVAQFFSETSATLRVGGRLLFSEPSGHVAEEHFARSLNLALAAGLRIESRPQIRISRSALLRKS